MHAGWLYFKDTLMININDNPLFFIASRQEQIIMAKLRMQCSNLNGHLYSMKIIDSPACSCGFVNENEFVLCTIDLKPHSKNAIAPVVDGNIKQTVFFCKVVYCSSVI